MDWSDWVKIRDQSFPICHFDYEPEIEYSANDGEYDELEIEYFLNDRECEEMDLNEKACDQAWRILMGKENAEILKLEEEVTTLEKKLAWADVSWSEMDSIPLREKVKSLDLSIRSLKNKNSEDGHVFCDGSLLLSELVERWQNILTHLPEKYFDQKARQANDLIMKEPVMASLQPEPDCIARKKNVSCSIPETSKEDELEEVTILNNEESAIADLHETDITVKKIDSSLSTLVTMRKEEVEKSIGGIIQESVSDDRQHKTDSIMANRTFSISIPETARNEEEVEQECAIVGDAISDASLHVAADPGKLTEQNNFYLSADFDISIPSPPILTKSSTEINFSGKVKFAGHISDAISCDLSRVIEGTGKNENEGADSNVKMEKNRSDTWGIGIREGPLSGTLIQDSETLAQFVNQKREQVSKNLKDRKNKKAKLVGTNYEPFSDVSLKALKPKPKNLFMRKEKVEHALYDLQKQSANSASKPQPSLNKPAIKQESSWMGLDLAHTISVPANSTESSSVESLCSAITDARMEETLEVLPSSRLLSAPPGGSNLESKTLTELKDLAKGMNLKGCSKLTKSKLIEKLRLELATRVKCTK